MHERAGPTMTDTVSDPHDAVLLELPWYVNGTADRATCAAIERHLAECPSCRAELRREKAVARAVAAGDAPLPAAQRASLQAAPRRTRRRRPVTTGVRRLLPAAAAAACLLVVVTPAEHRDRFRTLTEDSAAQERAVVRVLLARGAEEADLRRIAAREGLAVAAGPSAGGVYELEPLAGTDADAAARQLRKEPVVDFLEVDAE